VARLYAQLLHEVEALPSDTFEETSGAKLVHGGVTKLEELLGKLVDDGKSQLAAGDEVETDFSTKGKWNRSGVVKVANADSTYDVEVVEAGHTRRIERNVKRERVRLRNKGGVLFVDEA